MIFNSTSRSWVILLVLFLLVAAPAFGQDGELTDNLKVMTDPGASIQQRGEAERLLLDHESYSSEFLRILFWSLVAPPGDVNGTGSLLSDARYMPVDSQIGYATLRVWNWVVDHAGPAAERQSVLSGFFVELDAENRDHYFGMSRLLSAYMGTKADFEDDRSNWSKEAVQHLLRIFQERGWPAGSGGFEPTIARLILRAAMYNKKEKGRYREMVFKRVIERKGTWLGDSLLRRVIGFDDVRISRLVLDKYHAAKDITKRRSAISTIARHFGIRLEPERSPDLPVMSDAWIQAYDKAGRDWVNENETAAREGTYLSPKRREQREKQERINSIKEWWVPGSTKEDG